MKPPHTVIRYAIVCCCAISQIARSGAASVSVPGHADPWLSGMPAGSQASFCGQWDAVAQQSPVEAANVGLGIGRRLTFHATGGVAYGPLPSYSLYPPYGASD